MGQAESIHVCDVKDHPDIFKLDEAIREVRDKVMKTKELGFIMRDAYSEEIYREELKLYNKELLLHRKGQHAKSYISFWEYVRIVQRGLHHPEKQQRGVHQKSRQQKTKSTAMVSLSHAISFNIFSYFEAYLLRRLHIAMLLKSQREHQTKVWNKIVVFLYSISPPMIGCLVKVKQKFAALKSESDQCIADIRQVKERKVRVLNDILSEYRESALLYYDTNEEDEEDAVSNDPQDLCSGEVSSHSYKPQHSLGSNRRTALSISNDDPNWMRHARSKIRQSIGQSVPKLDDAAAAAILYEEFKEIDFEAESSNNRAKKSKKENKPLSGELDIGASSPISSIHDDDETIDSLAVSSLNTPLTVVITTSFSSNGRQSNKSIDDIRRRKRELEELRLRLSTLRQGIDLTSRSIHG
jgi:hypothetical protein